MEAASGLRVLERGQGTLITFTIPEAAALQEPSGDAQTVRSRDGRKILAVDDEHQVLRLLRSILDDHGYTTFATGNPDEMMHLLEMEQPQLVLMDLMMPGTSGFRVDGPRSRGVRRADHLPVCKRSGGERIARIEASLRKRGATGTAMQRQPYRLGGLCINYADRAATVSGRPVHLSATEYRLVFELSINAGRVMTHDQILQRVWGLGYSDDVQLLRATMRNLRHNLGDDARDPRYIFTEPRVGYRMPKGET